MKAYRAKRILVGQDFRPDSFLLVEGGGIAGIAAAPPAGAEVVDYGGHTLAPGLIDVHNHGALGCEAGYATREDMAKWASFEAEHGVTGFLPTTASIPLAAIQSAAEEVRSAMAAPQTNILGLHLEGPFFSRSVKIGAQNPRYIQGVFTREFKDFFQAYSDVIRYVAVDPALAAAAEIVPFCHSLGFRVSAAHSDISYADFLAKKQWGFDCITHTFNGMSGLDHRRPGLAYAACMDQDLYSEIICDGIHVNFRMIELFCRLKGCERTVLITDSLAAAGMPPGAYTLGGMEVHVTTEGRVEKGDGGLAGSTLTLDKAVRNLVFELKIPLERAIFMASTAPARMLGLEGGKGSLERGKDADFIVLDEDLAVTATYIKGCRVYNRN